MSEDVRTNIEDNLKSRSTWIRLLYMIFFAFALWIASLVMGAVVVVQFLFALITGNPNEQLAKFGHGLAMYCYSILLFLTFNSEDRPFPFSDWPDDA